MSARMQALAERRKALVARSDRERAELAALFGGIENRMWLVDTVVAGARRVGRNRFLVGAAGVLLVLAPIAARSWLRRAVWLLPVVIEGYRAVKSRGAAARNAGAPDASSTE